MSQPSSQQSYSARDNRLRHDQLVIKVKTEGLTGGYSRISYSAMRHLSTRIFSNTQRSFLQVAILICIYGLIKTEGLAGGYPHKVYSIVFSSEARRFSSNISSSRYARYCITHSLYAHMDLLVKVRGQLGATLEQCIRFLFCCLIRILIQGLEESTLIYRQPISYGPLQFVNMLRIFASGSRFHVQLVPYNISLCLTISEITSGPEGYFPQQRDLLYFPTATFLAILGLKLLPVFSCSLEF